MRKGIEVLENEYFMQELLNLIEYEQNPKYAKFLYDDFGIIVSADFSLLQKRLDSLIDNEIITKKNDDEENELIIYLSSLNRLELCDMEFDYAIRYLKNKGIKVISQNRVGSRIYGDRLLDDKENIELLKKYKETKDINIRNYVIEKNIEIVNMICRKYFMKKEMLLFDLSYDDIISFGLLGIVYATEGFDSDKSDSYIAYLYSKIPFFIKTRIVCHAVNSANYKLGRSYYKSIKELGYTTKDEMYDGSELIADSVLNNFFMKEEDRKYAKSLVNILNPISIFDLSDDYYDVGSQTYFEDSIFEYNELYENLDKLSSSDKDIICYLCGLGGYKTHTLEELAEFLLEKEYTKSVMDRRGAYQRVKNILNKIRDIYIESGYDIKKK